MPAVVDQVYVSDFWERLKIDTCFTFPGEEDVYMVGGRTIYGNSGEVEIDASLVCPHGTDPEKDVFIPSKGKDPTYYLSVLSKEEVEEHRKHGSWCGDDGECS